MSSISDTTLHNPRQIIQNHNATKSSIIEEQLSKIGHQAVVEAAKGAVVPAGIPTISALDRCFRFMSNPISATAKEIIVTLGKVNPQVYNGLQMFFSSEKIGLDPHERAGISHQQYQIMQQLDELQRKYLFAINSSSLSASIDMRQEAERGIRELLEVAKRMQ